MNVNSWTPLRVSTTVEKCKEPLRRAGGSVGGRRRASSLTAQRLAPPSRARALEHEGSCGCGRPSWLVAGLIPGVERQPKKRMDPDAEDLLRLLGRWRDEAVKGDDPSPPSPLPTKRAATASGS